MAKLHNFAAKYLKKEATRRFLRTQTTLLAIALIAGALFGLVLSHLGHWIVWLFVAALAILYYISEKIAVVWLDKVARERIMYLRGGQAEGLVAWILQGLDDRWHIFNGIQLEDNWDIDHIVVGPGGIYCISTKASRGIFELGSDGRVKHNGHDTNFATDVIHQATTLRERLTALLGSDVPFVKAVLAVPLGYVRDNVNTDRIRLVHQDNLLDSFDTTGRHSSAQIRRFVAALEMLEKSAGHLYTAPARRATEETTVKS